MKSRISLLIAIAVLSVGLVLGGYGCSASDSETDTTAPPAAVTEEPTELRVSAALTLKKSFEQLAPAFEEANNVKLSFNFGTAGVLQRQIEEGAPVDVFASASPKQVDAIIAGGFASADETATFARNQLVIVVPVDNPAGINTPADLAKATRIVTGDPVTTPHGASAKAWLESAGLFASLEPKLVFADTLDAVAQGEVEAGLVFVSSAMVNPKVEVAYTVPVTDSPLAKYVAVPVGASTQQELGKRFIEYLLSAEGQAALTENGFLPAP